MDRADGIKHARSVPSFLEDFSSKVLPQTLESQWVLSLLSLLGLFLNPSRMEDEKSKNISEPAQRDRMGKGSDLPQTDTSLGIKWKQLPCCYKALTGQEDLHGNFIIA